MTQALRAPAGAVARGVPVVHGLTVHRADEDTGAAGLTRALKDASLSLALGDATGAFFNCKPTQLDPKFCNRLNPYYAAAFAFVSLGGAAAAAAGALAFKGLARLVDTGALVAYSGITMPSLIQHAKDSLQRHVPTRVGGGSPMPTINAEAYDWMREFNKWQGATANSNEFADVLVHQYTELVRYMNLIATWQRITSSPAVVQLKTEGLGAVTVLTLTGLKLIADRFDTILLCVASWMRTNVKWWKNDRKPGQSAWESPHLNMADHYRRSVTDQTLDDDKPSALGGVGAPPPLEAGNPRAPAPAAGAAAWARARPAVMARARERTIARARLQRASSTSKQGRPIR